MCQEAPKIEDRVFYRLGMVIVRCPKCFAASPRYAEAIGASAEPVGYPDSAVVCGAAGCNERALIWLLGVDAIDYRAGLRLCFPIANNKAKVLVKQPKG
jgi:hypothetical protein